MLPVTLRAAWHLCKTFTKFLQPFGNEPSARQVAPCGAAGGRKLAHSMPFYKAFLCRKLRRARGPGCTAWR